MCHVEWCATAKNPNAAATANAPAGSTNRRPVCRITQRDTRGDSRVATDIGTINSPLTNTEYPRPSPSVVGRSTSRIITATPPNTAIPSRIAERLTPSTPWAQASRTSTSGELTRSSTHTHPARASSPTTASPTTGADPQPQLCPLAMARRLEASPTPSSTAPPTSTRTPGPRAAEVDGTTRQTHTAPATATTRATRNATRELATSTANPITGLPRP